MRNAIRKLQHNIEHKPWDEWLIENDRYLRAFCIASVIAAGTYFGIFTIIGLMR